MASVIGHATAATAICFGLISKPSRKILILAIICGILPDMDAAGFFAGIPYGSQWGHRGFTHSVIFALITTLILKQLFYTDYSWTSPEIKPICSVIFLSLLSHSILDAMTTGGYGVAFLWPLTDERYFLPFRPIKVSPMGISSFFSKWGIAVLKSEFLWIGIPSLLFVILMRTLRNSKI